MTIRAFCVPALLLASFAMLGCSDADKDRTPVLVFPTLTAELHGSSPAAANVRANASDLPVFLLRINGDSTQTCNVSEVVLTFRGTGLPSKVSSVKLYRDDGASSAGVLDTGGDTLLGTQAFAGSTVLFTFSPSLSLSPGADLDLFAAYTFSAGTPPSGGETYGASLASDADVDARGASSTLGAVLQGVPVDGALFTVAGRLQVTAGPAVPVAANHPVSTGDVGMLQVRLTASDENVSVGSIVFTGAASPGSLSQLTQAELVVDGNHNGSYEAGTDTILDGPKTFSGTTVTFSPARTINAGASEDWLLLFDFGATHANGDSFTASLQSASALTATGAASSAAAFVSVTPSPLAGNAQGVTTVPPGAIAIANGGHTPGNGNAAPNATNVLLLDLSVSETTGNEAAALNSLRFVLAGGGSPAGNPQAAISAVKLFRDDGDDAFEPGTGDALVKSGTVGGSNDVLLSALGETVAASGSVSYWLAADFNGTASSGSTFTASLANTDVGALGGTSGAALAATGGPVNARTVTMAKGALTIADGGHTPANGNIGPSAANVLLLDLSVSETSGFEGAALNSLRFVLVGGGSPAGSPQAAISAVKLWRDDGDDTFEPGTGDTLVQTGTVGGSNDVSYTSLGETVSVSGTVSYWLAADFNGSASSGSTFTASLANADVGAVGATTGLALPVTGGPVNARTVSVVKGALTIADGGHTPANGNVGASATNVLLLDLSVWETTGLEAASLNSLRFVLVGGGSPAGSPQAAISAVKLWRDDGDDTFEPGTGDTLVQTGTVGTGNDVSLTSLGETVAASGSVSYWMSVDFNGTASAGSTFTASLANADVGAVGATSAAALTTTGGPVNARTVTIAVVAAGTLTLSVSSGDATLPNFLRRTAAVGSANVAAALFNLAPTGEGANVSSITLTHGGLANGQTHVAAIRIWADVGSTAGAVDGTDVLLGSVSTGYGAGGTATIAVTRTINAASNENWIVAYDLTNACPYARTFTVSVAAVTDVTALGATSGNPMTIAGPSLTSGTRSLGGTWVQLNPTGTWPGIAASNYTRIYYAAAYDAQANRMIINGGADDGSSTNFTWFADTWALDLTAGSEQWNLLNAGGGTSDPPALWHHVAIYHAQSTARYFLVWGGYMNGLSANVQNTAWQMNLGANTWAQINTSTSGPAGREGAGAVWDPAGNRMLVFGGWEPGTSTMQADVWALSLGASPAWTQLLTSSATGAPSGRYMCTCVLDTSTSPARMIVHGGDNISGQTLSDAYALTLSATPTWSTLSTAAQVRSFHPSAIDSTANQVIVFGGWDGNGWVNLNDTEALDLARGAPAGTWGYHLTSGTAPSTREENRGVWDTVSNRFIIYGGWRGGSPIFTGTPDVWSFR